MCNILSLSPKTSEVLESATFEKKKTTNIIKRDKREITFSTKAFESFFSLRIEEFAFTIANGTKPRLCCLKPKEKGYGEKLYKREGLFI